MYHKSNFRRDLVTSGFMFGAVILVVAGGPAKTQPPQNKGQMQAGAELEDVDSTADVFDQAAPRDVASKPPKVEQEADSKQTTRKPQAPPPTPATSTVSMPGKPGLAVSSLIANQKPKTKTKERPADPAPNKKRTIRPPTPPERSNPVEMQKKPLNKMSDAEIKGTLAEYRTWVHQGQIEIQLDMSRLSAADVAKLVEFFVMGTDASRMRISRDGSTSRLGRMPEGRLITDLVNESQWPPGTRAKADAWFGGGIVDVNVAIVLNKLAELQLYRVLVDGLNGEHPAPGSSVVIAIGSNRGELVFDVVKVSSQGGTKA